MLVRTDTDKALLEMARAVMAISLRAADRVGDVSVTQLRALSALAGTGSVNLSQFAAQMGVTVSTASRLVDRLIGADLVERRTAANSRREVRVQLTDHGRRILDAYDHHRLDELHRCLAAFDEQDRQPLLTALTTISATRHDPPGSTTAGG